MHPSQHSVVRAALSNRLGEAVAPGETPMLSLHGEHIIGCETSVGWN
jgi:hypothetical protein